MYTTKLKDNILVGTYQELVTAINKSGLIGNQIFKLKNQQT